VSVHADGNGWSVRWRDGSGRQRGKRFSSEEAAQAFDSAVGEITPGKRRADATSRSGGVYPYSTKHGTRWYFKARDTNGLQTSKRGFSSEKAARDAKRRLTERIERGEALGAAGRTSRPRASWRWDQRGFGGTGTLSCSQIARIRPGPISL
jgi:hypothetical protein